MSQKSRFFTLPETGTIVFHAVMRSGENWYQLDWDEKQGSLQIPGGAIPAVRELLKQLDAAEAASPDAPCTEVNCVLSFPHTNRLHNDPELDENEARSLS